MARSTGLFSWRAGRWSVLLVTACAFTLARGEQNERAAISPYSLTCEYRTDPLGIDITRPRLSWKVFDPDATRGQKQTAYQILVATEMDRLSAGMGDLWDSGKVASDQSVQVTYAGTALKSEQACYWKVRIWDKDGCVSSYSRPAKWSMGLLHPEDWVGAHWIGSPPPGVDFITVPRNGEGTWYGADWTDDGTTYRTNVSGSEMALTFDGTSIQWLGTKGPDRGVAEVYVDGVKDGEVDCHSATLQGQQVLYNRQHRLWPGQHTLRIKVKEDKNPASSDHYVDVDSFKYSRENPYLPPASYWRKGFSTTLEKSIRRATLYASALGAYEFHINGARVGDDYLNPGWTQFTTRLNPDARSRPHRVYYRAYDVTPLLSPGSNALGAILSTGWYAGHIWAGAFNYGTVPELLAKLRIEYSDGTSQVVVTDGSWKLTYNGPIREGDVQQGESYDARLEMGDWSSFGYDDTGWSAPQTVIAAGNNDKFGAVIRIQPHPAQPIRKTESREPVAVTDVGDGKFVVKFDQQMSGWMEFRGVQGAAGTRIKLQYSSAIHPDGTIYTDHLRDARGQDFYTLNGSGNESWEPRFTYHGFQYVEVTGWPGIPTTANFTAHIVHTDAPLVHAFESSDPRIDRLDKMVEYSIRTNTLDIPAACADRAERLGWMGDRNCLLGTEFYYLDTAAFLTKWMQDIVDSQAIGVTGTYHQVCPIWGDIESAGWSEAGTHLPHIMLKVYGDTRLAETHYRSLCEYASYLMEHLDADHLRTGYMYHPSENFIGYGDWLAIDQDREGDYPRFNTIENYASMVRAAELAAVLGKSDDAARFAAVASAIKAHFNDLWVTSDGVIPGESQTLYALAFQQDLIEDRHATVEQVTRQFVNEILNKSHVQAFPDALGGHPTIPAGHLTTGFHGTKALLPSLSKCGRNDVAYSLLLKDTYPSWLYCLENGMTTAWERWDSWTPDKGFQSAGMNSFNLPAMQASVGGWLMGYAAGIQPEGVGFQRIRIKPHIGHGLTFLKASYDSPYGVISVHWRKNPDGSLEMDVMIPANTTATVCVPNYSQVKESASVVWDNGVYHYHAVGVTGARLKGDSIEFAVMSGTYRFHARGPRSVVEHSAEGVVYGGTGWSHDPDQSRTNTAGSSVSYEFEGTGFTWIGDRSPDRGFADVFIDGVQVATVDTYRPTPACGQELFSRIGLPSGRHTLRLTCKGQKHPASSDYHIGLARLAVIGP